VLWLHLMRVTKPRINPPRGLMIGTGLSLIVLAAIAPATSQAPADLARVPGVTAVVIQRMGPAIEEALKSVAGASP